MPVVPLLEEEEDDNDDGSDDDNIADSDVDYYDECNDNYDDANCSTLGSCRVQGDLIQLGNTIATFLSLNDRTWLLFHKNGALDQNWKEHDGCWI